MAVILPHTAQLSLLSVAVVPPVVPLRCAAWWTRPVELVFMACYWFIFGYLLVWCTLPTWPIRIGFVLISHLVTMILHVQITLSHWGMPTSDLGPTESFPQRQMRTTMDVECPAWLDWIHDRFSGVQAASGCSQRTFKPSRGVDEH